MIVSRLKHPAQRSGSRRLQIVINIRSLDHLRDVNAVPATVAKATATCTKGMLAWRDQGVGILDDQLLFDHLNRSLA